MQVAVAGNQQALALEVGGDVERHVLRRVCRGAGEAPGLPTVAILEDPELVDRIEHRQPELPGKREVLLAAAGRNMHDPRPLLIGDLAPGDDRVLHTLLHR